MSFTGSALRSDGAFLEPIEVVYFSTLGSRFYYICIVFRKECAVVFACSSMERSQRGRPLWISRAQRQDVQTAW